MVVCVPSNITANKDSCFFSDDALGISILTLSIIGFFILFSVASYLSTREEKIYGEKESYDLERMMTDPYFRLLSILAEPAIVGKFFLSSMFYLSALLLCLINFFIKSPSLLILNLVIVTLTTGLLVCIFGILLWRAKFITTEDVTKFISDKQWLSKGKNREGDKNEERK